MDKNKYRKKCIKQLKKASSQNRRYFSHKVEQKLEKMFKGMKNRDILLYWPLDMEIDVTSLIKKLRKNNRVYLPFMQGDSFKMVPCRLPLTRKKFNIFESGDTLRNISKIDIAIIPVVGVDSQAKRIGFGKGMYDRFFEKLPSSPLMVFTQLSECYIKKSLCDRHDIRADLLITPKADYCQRRIKYVNGNSSRRYSSERRWSSRLFNF